MVLTELCVAYSYNNSKYVHSLFLVTGKSVRLYRSYEPSPTPTTRKEPLPPAKVQTPETKIETNSYATPPVANKLGPIGSNPGVIGSNRPNRQQTAVAAQATSKPTYPTTNWAEMVDHPVSPVRNDYTVPPPSLPQPAVVTEQPDLIDEESLLPGIPFPLEHSHNYKLGCEACIKAHTIGLYEKSSKSHKCPEDILVVQAKGNLIQLSNRVE